MSHMARADAAFSKFIRARDGVCVARNEKGFPCKGQLQCAHIRGRSEHAIRVDPDNAIALCQAHHLFYTHRPADWDDFIEREFPGRYEQLWYRIRRHRKNNLKVDWAAEAAYWESRL